MAPVAGRHYARARRRHGHGDRRPTPAARATTSAWSARPDPLDARDRGSAPTYGHMTGFPSVDVRSHRRRRRQHRLGRRGRAAARRSAERRRRPGPACYGRGGTRPTVTDACARARVHRPRLLPRRRRCRSTPELARAAIERDVGDPLGLDRDEAAAAIRARHRAHGAPRSRTSRSSRASTRARRCWSAAAAAPA